MQTCDHLNQLMSQVLQTQILQITRQSQILSMFTLSSEGCTDALCRCGGACYRLIVYAKNIFLEKNDMGQAFTVQPRLASNSWLVPLLQPVL